MGQIWGDTTREEAVATARLAADKGINHFDMAPMYGRGEAEIADHGREPREDLVVGLQVDERARVRGPRAGARRQGHGRAPPRHEAVRAQT